MRDRTPFAKGRKPRLESLLLEITQAQSRSSTEMPAIKAVKKTVKGFSVLFLDPSNGCSKGKAGVDQLRKHASRYHLHTGHALFWHVDVNVVILAWQDPVGRKPQQVGILRSFAWYVSETPALFLQNILFPPLYLIRSLRYREKVEWQFL